MSSWYAPSEEPGILKTGQCDTAAALISLGKEDSFCRRTGSESDDVEGPRRVLPDRPLQVFMSGFVLGVG